MRVKWLFAIAVVMTAAGLFVTARSQTRAPAGGADEAAIRQSSQDFAIAFNKGDAKAVAALWTEAGECHDADGQTYVGRAAIEKAFATAFRANPSVTTEVLVKSVRFPAKDLAIEEGLLRNTRGPKDLPATSAYVAVHTREGGTWKVALSTETGAGQDRLEDLDWLLGDWTGQTKDVTVKASFTREPKKAAIMVAVAHTPTGKEPVAGTVRIGLDPETGQLRSWGFEDDGSHSQSLWMCDGKNWLLDTRGVLADGTPTAEVVILHRVAEDVLTWRSVDRVVGDSAQPDTAPVRLVRTPPKIVTPRE
jgi:uncharacterized protein (TIGR02246 family)